MLQSFLKALKLTVVRNPQLLSNPMCSGKNGPVGHDSPFSSGPVMDTEASTLSVCSASQGPDAAGRGADPVSSYCCPLEVKTSSS